MQTPQGVEFHLPGGRCQWIGDRLDHDMALTSLFSMTDSLGSRRAG